MALTPSSVPPLQCDDEETLTLLIKTGDVDAKRLDGFQKRLEEDFAVKEGNQYWDELVKGLNRNFRYASTALPEAPTAAASATKDDRLETDEGKKHIAALCALLQISKTRAIEVTRGIVQKLYKNEKLLPALLGTSDFFLKCVAYHSQQRLIRLQILTECLQVEQDDEKPASEPASKVLDSLDETFEDESRQRGLFRRLLTIACTPLVLPTRDQMSPCHDLTFKTTSGSSAYNSIAASLLEETRLRTNRERVQAMEALLVLLYHRIKGGIHRPDLCILVQAFQACGMFESKEERLPHLAGLICAESMQLWRAFQPDNQILWASQHPMLLEASSNRIQMETEALKTILLDSSSEVTNLQGPQSLALLSFGLLLRLAYDSLAKSSTADDSQPYWRTFQASGAEIVTIANEWGFEYLNEAISNLVESDLAPSSTPQGELFQFYDWQLSNPKSSPMLLEADTEINTPADIVLYTSIAREVVVSSILAFPNILSTESTENLGMLCNLASYLYQANPVLAEEFWSLWQDFISSNPPEMPLPMCDLFHAAHGLANRALAAYQQKDISSEVLLPAVAPFFQLLASLCHSPDIVEATLDILDDGLIRSALLACYLPEAVAGSEEYISSRTIVLNALVNLSKTGPSKASLEKLRLSMEDTQGNQVMVDGPRVLTRIAISTNDPKVIDPVLQLMASLLDGASQRWAMQLARQCMPSQRQKSVLATFLEPGTGTTNAAATVLAGFIEQMTSVVFCDSFQDNDATAFLQVVGEGILSSGTALIPYMSTSASSIGEVEVCYETAEVVLRAFARFLSLIRAVMELHPSPAVKSAAYDVRDSLINTLATSVSLGEAIAHYAVAPVSLGIAARLWDALESGEIGTEVLETKSEGEKSFGKWQFVASKNNGQDSDVVRGKKLLLDAISEFCGKDLDLEGLQQKNWTGTTTDRLAPLRVAESAMQLLSMWSLHVDDIVTDRTQGSDSTLVQSGFELISQLSPYGILTSRATCPYPCRENSTFSASWESAGIPNFDLVLAYFADPGDDSTTASAIPTIVSLDVLHACIVHARQSSSIDSEGASVVFRAVHNSERLPKLISNSISTANQLADKSTLTGSDNTAVLHGLLGLRLLCACIEASPAIADKMLHMEGTPLLPALTKMASKVRGLLGLPDESAAEVLNSNSAMLQMRLAAGAVTALSAVWTSARSMTPGPSGSASARLGELVDEEASFVTDLLTAVMEYSSANDIESKIPPSTESEYARCALTTFMSRSLDILATEVAYYRCSRENRNPALEAAMKGSFFQPQRFTGFNGFKYAAVSTMHFGSMGFDRLQCLTRPTVLLDCFPTTATWQSSHDAYVLENTFDVGAATKWLSEISQQEDDEIERILSRLSVTHQFAVCDLRLISSWKRLAESLVLFYDEENARANSSNANSERLVVLAKDTLQALHLNIAAINEAQVEVSEDFMQTSGNQMAKALAELFLFLLEMAFQDEAAPGLLDNDDILDFLELLAKTSEMVHTMVSVSRAGAFATGSLEMCCTLERPLLAAAILLDSVLGARATLSRGQLKRERDVCTSLCRVASTVLRVLGKVLQEAASDPLVTDQRKGDNRETLRCCISLFTILVAKGHGSQMSDASYFKLVSKTLVEYDALKEIIDHGMQASNAAASSILSSEGDEVYGTRGPSSTEIDSLVVVQSVLNLLYSVAETDNADMLSIFIGTQLSQFVTRNPLFQYVGRAWTQNARNAPPRGYVLSREAAASNRSSILPGSLQLYRSDPLHSIWLTSMKVLQTSLRSSTRCLNIQGTESIGKHFFSASVEFLEIHRVAILSCLKSCGSELTGNMLLEATQIFALASELFKRDHRDAFFHTSSSMCEELIEWAKAVIVNISKLLGAAGTARELFRGLEEHESMDPDLIEHSSGPNDNKARHPLLSGGRLQDAKHEAYKFSHFAARCCKRVTGMDIKSGSTVPSRLRHLSLDRKNDEPLEQACRLSVTSDYAMRMERVASQCLSQAVSTVWKTHPVSHSFKVFSEREVMQLDVMNLVQNGVVIGYRTSCGESLLVDGTSETFDDLRFGRVCSGDTLNRTWTVKVIRGDGDVATGEVEAVRARQLAGIEDVSMRKVATAYLPAPDTIESLEKGSPSLSVGHLILVLRWCHQKFVSLRESKLPDGPAHTKNVIRIAEQTVALLAAELSIHAEIESDLNMPKAEKSQLDFQIYEMFADPEVLSVLDTNVPISSAHMQQGRLKDLIQGPAWDAIRPQVRQEMERCLKAIKEHEQKPQKRSFGETNWYSGNLGRSRGYKSAFRG
ncbi:unnamed protein product [Cylindrotheca closterium]|uniref:Uncharacterized protein n=1 Tax=Cylindrotheca closterium TaxID=2856 RepID=A0AAD2FXT1_9STRA|nr:unnamed protein product [Cylindrotheca closterium]